MNIFNSLGSNYSSQFVINSIYAEHKHARKKLIALLQERYKGDTYLFYKARTGITQALLASKLEEDSYVAVTGYTCIAVIDAIKKAGMRPIFLDIDPDTLNFTAQTLEKTLKEHNIKVVIIQNTLGFPCNIEEIAKICKKHKLILIEDLAHSMGSRYKTGKEAGTVGDFTVLSFSQDKVVDAVSGGALISKEKIAIQNDVRTTDASTQDKLYPFLTHIIRKTYKSGLGKFLHLLFKHLRLLSNPMKNDIFKGMSDWHAALAVDGFLHLESQLTHRRKISNVYKKYIKKECQFWKLSENIENATCLRFPIKVGKRAELIEYARQNGLYISDIWYDAPIAPKKFINKSGYTIGECKNAESVAEGMVNLPTHINVSEVDAKDISELINTWHTQHK